MRKKVIPDDWKNQNPNQQTRPCGIENQTRQKYKNITKSCRQHKQANQKYWQETEQEKITTEDHKAQFQYAEIFSIMSV